MLHACMRPTRPRANGPRRVASVAVRSVTSGDAARGPKTSGDDIVRPEAGNFDLIDQAAMRLAIAVEFGWFSRGVSQWNLYCEVRRVQRVESRPAGVGWRESSVSLAWLRHTLSRTLQRPQTAPAGRTSSSSSATTWASPTWARSAARSGRRTSTRWPRTACASPTSTRTRVARPRARCC